MSSLQPMGPRYVSSLFGPLHRELIALLRRLTDEEWQHPTVAGKWRVRDVAAHLLDTQLRKMSGPRADGRPLVTYEEVVAFINELNARGVEYWKTFSPKLLTDVLEISGAWVADDAVSLDPHAPARFSVLWAGESQSENWMDTGREYTEWWHHQMQIRDAVGAGATLLGARWLEPLLDFSVRVLPRAYEAVEAPEKTSVSFEVDAIGSWSIVRENGAWHLYRGTAEAPSALVQMNGDTAWRLFYNAPFERKAVRVIGEEALIEPLLRARSVMV